MKLQPSSAASLSSPVPNRLRRRRAAARWAAAGLSAFLMASVSRAQGPTGPELQVNAYTTGSQTSGRVVSRPDGSFLVIWKSRSSASSSRHFDAAGAPLTPEHELDEDPYTSVAVGGDGGPTGPAGFVVLRDRGFGGTWDVVSQKLDADGVEVGAELVVNVPGTDNRRGAVAALPGGGFLVAWSQEQNVLSRRLDAAGQPLGSQMLLATSPESVRGAPVLAVNGAGNFLAAWSEQFAERRIRAVFGGPDGQALGPPFSVSPAGAGDQTLPTVAADSTGGFFVAWNEATDALEGAWLSDAGAVQAGVTLGALDPPDRFAGPRAACDDAQRCGVTWQAAGEIASRWLTRGGFLSGAIQVNSYTEQAQESPTIDCGDGGECVIVWQSGGRFGPSPDGDGTAVRAQRFTFDPTLRARVSPFERQICAGEETSFAVAVDRFNGFAGAVSLAAQAPGGGAAAQVTPGTVGAGQTEANLRYVGTAGLAPGDYPLEVTAQGPGGAPANTADLRIRVVAAVTPTPLAPAEGGVLCQSAGQVFSWSASPDDPTYTVELARDDAFGDVIFSARTAATTLAVPDDLPPGRYFWRVGACATLQATSSFEILGDCGPDPSGPEVRVDDSGDAPEGKPVIALSCTGTALAAWGAVDAQGGRSIRGRWLASGIPIGPSIQISTGAGDHRGPVVRVTRDGNFTVLWKSGPTLHWRSYDGATLAGGVERTAAVEQEPASLDIAPNGGVAATWRGERAGGELVVHGRRFDAAGAGLGGLLELGSAEPPFRTGASQIAQSDGGFVVSYGSSYLDYGAPSLSTQIRANRFDAAGSPLATEFAISGALYSYSSFTGELVGLGSTELASDGSFVVTTSRNGNDYYTEFRSAGVIAVDNQDTRRFFDPIGDAADSALDVGRGGEFLVVWNDSSGAVSGRRYAVDEVEPKPQKVISSTPATLPSVDIGDPSSQAAVVWRSETCEGDSPCVLFRAIRGGPGLLADGFESGEVDAWCRAIGVD